MFAPEVARCDADGLDIKFQRCPLQQAWLDADLAPEDVATLCRIAAQVDSGMFEAGGFRFHADTYRPRRRRLLLPARPSRWQQSGSSGFTRRVMRRW